MTVSERRSFWLVWALGVVAVAGLIYFGAGGHSLSLAASAAFEPVDSFARAQLGQPYADASYRVGLVAADLSRTLGSLARSAVASVQTFFDGRPH
jgi:hypothetical protein